MAAKSKKTVCVDVDGVLFVYEGWKGIHHFGKPIAGAAEMLKKLHEDGYEIVIHTTRANPDVNTDYITRELREILAEQLVKHGMVFNRIEGKPIAVGYIDDRAIPCRPDTFGVKAFYGARSLLHTLHEETKRG